MSSLSGGVLLRVASRRPALLLLSSLILAACAEKLPASPRPISVSPARAPNDLDTKVLIAGEGLRPRFVTDFDDQDQSKVTATYRAYLGDVELRDVRLSATGDTLEGVIPLGLEPRSYTVIVEDPLGRRGELPDGFEVLDAATLPRKLTLTSRAMQLRVGSCSTTPVTFELRGGDDAPIATTSDLAVSLAAPPLRFFDDAGCAGPAISSLVIPAGGTTGAFFLRGTSVGTFNLTLAAPQLTDGVQAQLIVGANGCLPTDPDGSPCDDGDACTTSSACDGGVCGGAVQSCAPPTACHDVGLCNPANGACANVLKPSGSSCEDGLSCTGGETCVSNFCAGANSFVGCQNTQPHACFTASPLSAGVGTARTFNADCSRDLEDPLAALEARFDFNGDNTFDTAFGALQQSHTYPTAGTFRAQVEVRDDAGVTAFASRYVVASTAAEEVIVTTSVDENDGSASPLLPGGTGLSFREAVAYANGGTGRVVRWGGPMTLTVGAVVRVTATNFAIVGGPGVNITFTGAGPCLELDGTGNRLLGVRIAGCPGAAVEVGGNNAVIADNDLRGTASVVLAGTGAQFVNNDVHSVTGDGVRITGASNTVDGNRIHDNSGAGISFAVGVGPGVLLQRNLIYRNGGAGITVANNVNSPNIRFNVLDSNGGNAVTVGNVSAAAQLRNNIISRNAGLALSGSPATVAPFGPNLFFRNGGGTSSGVDAGFTADPLFFAADGGDFRVRPESGAINAGVDLGLDVNGPAAGNFNGSAPEVGAYEAP